MVQKQAKQVFGLGVACRVIRYRYRYRYRTDRPDIRQALILRVTLSFHMLAVALSPADLLDGRTLDVELLMTEWHRAFSFSIPIPTPTPIALRRCLDSLV
jgi:hypothetical protein